MRRSIALSFLGFTALLGPACGGASPSDAHGQRTGSTRQADLVLFQIVSSPPSLLPPELGPLISTAKDISSVYSGITDAIAILNLLGVIPTDPTATELFQRLDKDLFDVGAAIYDGSVANTRAVTLASALTAAADADKAAAHGQMLAEFEDDDTNSATAVRTAESPQLFKRLYVEASTNGSTGWKNVIPDRPDHSDGTVYDWRLNLPHLMYTIGLRLKVMTAIHPNWRVDGWFDHPDMTEFRDNLNAQLVAMLAEVRCGTIRNFTNYGDADGPRYVNDSETVACADINTGISASQGVGQGFADLGACTTITGTDPPSSYTDQACVDRLNAYNADLQHAIDDVRESLYRRVVQQMPIFEVRSMVDTLSFYLAKTPDLTALSQRIPVERALNLCLDVSGVNDSGSPLFVTPCSGAGSQSWAYDRRSGSIQNTQSGKCLDVRAIDAMPGTPVQIWDCNGGTNQQWTYDPVSHVLENALSTVLDIQNGNLQSGTPVWTWSRNEGLAQQWHADGPPVNIAVAPPSSCGVLMAGEGLQIGQAARSCDGRFDLYVTPDGNLRLSQSIAFNPPPPPPAPSGTSVLLWQTDTGGLIGATLVMQGDGNLVFYDASGSPAWASNTAGNPGAFAIVQDDGNLVVYDAASQPLWASNTCCH